jgi:hypothetical protein
MRYGLDQGGSNVSKEVVAILDGRIDYEDQGLSADEKQEVETQLQRTLSLPLDDLIATINNDENEDKSS